MELFYFDIFNSVFSNIFISIFSKYHIAEKTTYSSFENMDNHLRK